VRPGLLVAIAVVGMGCSSGHTTAKSHSTDVTTPTYGASEVVAVQSTPYPEGPASPRVAAGESGWARIAAALPATLPARLVQPPGCSMGNITTITIKGGKTIDYGPCLRPRSIDDLRCLLAHQPIGCR
jgi:hypothetical protein